MVELVRDRWTSRSTFVFAAIGSAIGLGNVWRFPYLTYDNGGGAFLIAWMIGLIILGIPWMMMEFGMGRYFQKSAPGAFEGVGKKWEWLGWWPVTMAFLIVTYYTVVIAWAIRYVFSSATVAWGMGEAGASGAGDFFFGSILQLSDGPTALGSIVWPTVAALAIVWLLIYLIVFKGARIVGQVSVWIVSLAWVALIVLVVRGLTLPGVAQGLNFYLAPDFTALGSGDLWFAAFSQIAFTLSLGMAGMFAYASFIKKKADITNNAFITSFSNCATSFFAGFAVFSVVGFIMQAMSVPVGDVSASGLGLAFVTFPVAISMMPGANAFIGVIFFICLALLGLSSAYFLAYGGVIAPVVDKFGISRNKAAIIVCAVCFVVGLLYTTQGGLFWLDIVDRTAAFYGLIITGALACIVVGWVFKAEKLREHLNGTSDIKVGRWWNWMIKLVIPAALIFVVIYGGFAKDIASPYEGYSVAWVIWLLLGVTLVLSFILQAIRTKKAKEVK